jgi:hypothetical protein
MVIVFWSPSGFPVIQALPPRVTFTAEFFVDKILPEIVAAQPSCDKHRQLVLHIDNASPHMVLTTQKLEENRIKASPHPAFSPDLTLSGFFSSTH